MPSDVPSREDVARQFGFAVPGRHGDLKPQERSLLDFLQRSPENAVMFGWTVKGGVHIVRFIRDGRDILCKVDEIVLSEQDFLAPL